MILSVSLLLYDAMGLFLMFVIPKRLTRI